MRLVANVLQAAAVVLRLPYFIAVLFYININFFRLGEEEERGTIRSQKCQVGPSKKSLFKKCLLANYDSSDASTKGFKLFSSPFLYYILQDL
jgi:hypothetical protein